MRAYQRVRLGRWRVLGVGLDMVRFRFLRSEPGVGPSGSQVPTYSCRILHIAFLRGVRVIEIYYYYYYYYYCR